jgi:hypothetical protein
MTRRWPLTAAMVAWSAWLGAALLTVAVVAPGAFAVLPSRSLAGSMVGRVLPVVLVAGMVVGLVVAALLGAAPGRRVPAVTALCAAAACAVSHFLVDPRIAQLRVEIGVPVDALPVDDARRVAFGLLHGYSVGGLGVAMLAGTLSLAFILHIARPAGDGRAHPN